jgi:redox-sensitive bicupin YhaK (pirin superfamily)
MITVRRSSDRGHADFGWLDTHHTFSFGDYYDPRFMGFRQLRVINEDRVEPGAGFPTHGHRDMEIISYVLEGELEHKDSLGTGSVIRPGDVQRMSAGRGITHSEYNASSAQPLHFLQIWILPESGGLPPGYEQRHYAAEERQGRWRLIASRQGRDGSVTLHQDVALHATLLEPGQGAELTLAPGRHGWVQVARGQVELGGHTLEAGDGAAVSEERSLRVVGTGDGPAEVLAFDLA